ncbi:MAG: DUF2339 domain-containing protein [Crocinitomix sp.]|nr:DUF2339 domain-containing protein [Crocinitomix sp.]
MVILIVLIVGVVTIILLTSFRQEVKKNLRIVNKNIINVRKELDALREDQKLQPADPDKKAEEAPAKPKLKPLEVSGQRLVSSTADEKAETEKPAEQPKVEPTVEAPKVAAEKKPPVIQKPTESPKPVAEEKPVAKEKAAIEKPAAQAAFTAPAQKRINPRHKIKPTPKPKRDLEKIIGENWLNKIGIAVLVIGIGFFVKYAIDKNWIGEIGRVAIGIGLGGILIGIAHFLRKKYHAFSSVLIGGGISVLYYTIAIAYHDYHIFDQKTAFGIMVLITLFSTIISVIYDRKELAIIALIGAFTSPFMVSDGTGNYKVFFTYIAIINSGMLILSYFKKWDILSKLSLGFTVLFFGAWMITTSMYELVPAKWALIFATIFYVQFLGMSLIYNLVRKVKFTAWEFIQLTGITALFYGAMMYVIQANNYPIGMGEFTLIMSGSYIGLAFFVHLREGADKSLVYLLIGKAIAFVTLTGGLLFDGDYMTLFWAVEAVVILALGQRANMNILKNSSAILTIIAVFGLGRDWFLTYAENPTAITPVFNGTFLTGLFVIGTLFATFILIKREKDETENTFVIGKSQYHFAVGALIFAVSYLTILFELTHQLRSLNYREGAILFLWIYHLVLVIIGNLIARTRQSDLMAQIFFFVGVVGTFFYLIVAQNNNFEILKDTINVPSRSVYYFTHFGMTVGVIALLLILRKGVNRIFETQVNRDWFLAGLSVVGLIIATVELDQILGYMFTPSYSFDTVLRHSRTEGYTILWGLYSFLLMIRGMQKKNQIMRVLSLIMFSATLLKLFIFDIQNISEAGKIVAFISLGVLLLVISFLYQKLKAIIVDGKVDGKDDDEVDDKVE